MSAFEVGVNHIDAMLTAGMRFAYDGHSPLTWFWPEVDAATNRGDWTSAEAGKQARDRRRQLNPDTAGRVGAVLLAENRRSVDHRYDETEIEQPYNFTPLLDQPDPVCCPALRMPMNASLRVPTW